MNKTTKKDSKFENPEFTHSELDKEDGFGRFNLQWGAVGIGFGEFTFFYRNGVLMCDNECMSKEFVKKALCAMVDNCTSVDEGVTEEG
jgi:hypothetical protein